ncbi:response regulator [Bosea sp. 2RAB26]|uniref:response regulator n=1 Tax=Bosea sp. 2RAB26 TaxID=3237476 RepID=UPI003F8E17F5
MADFVVLVVEDDVFIRLDATSMLEDAGFEALEASNADDAVKLLEARPDIRIVFTDIEMPGSLNGLKLAFVVRDRWPPIAIIIASGRIQPEPHEMPADVTFLRKPYSHAAVLEAVQIAA